ncbi:hypothetical protein [Qipengyuania sp. DGS5-3]|uniref:hypothetical protein n=1 Tax=Qipengyuania sp. DGS5-3 TaxID=3349632 RepID=UPI0036D38132
MTSIHSFTGQSGTVYQFNVAPTGFHHGDVAGIYILLAGSLMMFDPKVLYVGKTASALDRPGGFADGHHVQAAANTLGFSHIGFLAAAYELQRDNIEQDLIAGLNPPLNVQHRTNAFTGLGRY